MQKKFGVILLLASLVLLNTVPAFAETVTTPTPTTQPTSTSDRGRFGSQKRLQEFKDRLDKRESELKDKIASREAQLKERLATFRDKKRAQTAENVSNRLNMINKNRVEQMTRNVNVFDDILTKVKARVAEAKAKGKDVSSIETTIAAADTAIANARAAITTQAGKDYTLSATDETKIRDEAKAKRTLLETDLKATYATVKLAREAVRKSIQAAYKTLGKHDVDVTETPSVTGTITGTLTPTATGTTVPTNTSTPVPTATPTI